jgi:hypothetical protein
LGLAHDWYKIQTDQVISTVAVYLICWIVVIVMLTLATLKLPVAFTILLSLVDVALMLLLGNLFAPSSILQMSASAFMSFAFGGRGLLWGFRWPCKK